VNRRHLVAEFAASAVPLRHPTDSAVESDLVSALINKIIKYRNKEAGTVKK
jgi:hypothetical protein